MTAVIGILNKSGIALAADSAVTFTGPNGRKVLNTANKIFTLSKSNPVGIMIYNSASFMDIPWEVIIKEYRRKLKDKKFSTLVEYQTDFTEHVKHTMRLLDGDYVQNILIDIISSIYKSIYFEIFGDSVLSEENEEFTLKVKEKVSELVSATAIEISLPDFIDYKFDDFEKSNSDLLENGINDTFGKIKISIETKRQLKEVVFNYVRSTNFSGNWSGLIIVGYGDEEIYPSCIPINIAEVVNGKLRYYVDKENSASISTKNNAAIRPFAQRDVIDILLTGVDFELNDVYIKSFGRFVERYTQAIIQKIGDKDPALSNSLKNSINIDSLTLEYSQLMSKVKQQKHIRPTMQTVASLSKEDLAEMAESLVYLTYLKRRISSAEESVGGPVDVALISKGDGFIWIKRKHYFKPELNRNFINNYLNI